MGVGVGLAPRGACDSVWSNSRLLLYISLGYCMVWVRVGVSLG